MGSKLTVLVLAGMALVASSGSAFAQDYGYRGYGYGDRYYKGQDLRHDYHQSYRLREDIERDQARLDNAYRWGRYGEAEAIRRDLKRDYRRQRALDRDINRDERHRWSERGYYR